jgi:hypothetical protein
MGTDTGVRQKFLVFLIDKPGGIRTEEAATVWGGAVAFQCCVDEC